MPNILLIGLDEPEVLALKERIKAPILAYDMLPDLRIDRGNLLVEWPDTSGRFVPVAQVVFHGIFEHDYPIISALALWGGPCLPRAIGMMDCRHRLPCLVRALEVSRFGRSRRGFLLAGQSITAAEETVAKWGEWHCGENKARFTGRWTAPENSLLEPFVEGEAVRVHVLDDRLWQIRLAGAGWLKSIHHAQAGFMALDPDLAEDARRLQSRFGLEMLAMDYIVAPDGGKYLLEVNHIPNVTLFPELREAYLDYVVRWQQGATELR